jgi:hypothetical protein
MKLDKEEGHVYAITAAGKEAILKAVLTQSSSQDERDSPSQPAGEPDRLNRHSLRKKFWDGLLSRPKVKATRHADLSPVEYGWIGAGTGVRGLQLVYVTGQEEGRVEVYIDRGAGKAAENKRIFDQLQAHKSEIEVTFGGELSWQRLDEKQACRIAHTMTDGGYRSEEAKWPEIHDAMIEAMMRLEKAIIPHLENLKQD